MDKPTFDEAAGKLGLCLICRTKGTLTSPTRRGRCNTHYPQFLELRDKLPESEWYDFEQDLIKAKLLLPERYKPTEEADETEAIAQKYLAKTKRGKAIKKAQAKQATDTPRKEDVPTKRTKKVEGK